MVRTPLQPPPNFVREVARTMRIVRGRNYYFYRKTKVEADSIGLDLEPINTLCRGLVAAVALHKALREGGSIYELLEDLRPRKKPPRTSIAGESYEYDRSQQANNTSAMVERIKSLLLLGYMQAIGAQKFSRKDWRPLYAILNRLLGVAVIGKGEVPTEEHYRNYFGAIRKRLDFLKKTNGGQMPYAAASVYFKKVDATRGSGE